MNSTSSTKPIYHVAVLLFPGADILDYAGPMEVLIQATRNDDYDTPEQIFAVETVGREKDVPIRTGQGTLSVQPSIYIEELLKTLSKFNVLIVPGGQPKVVQRVIETQDGLELEVIKTFAKLPPQADGQERIILSICTGAFLLGAVGLLSGLKVTTHHLAIDQLREICNGSDAAGAKTEVLGGQRYVDAGAVKDNLRVITAGGVSSGLDATLHLVELLTDRETAEVIAKVIEYDRRQS